MIKLPALCLLRQLVSFRCTSRAVVGVSSFAGSVALQAETVAYWRFETGPANASVLHATAAGVYDGTTRDVSGNRNHLSMWSQGGGAGFAYRADVPFATVPQDGIVNRFSIKNTGGSPASFTSAAASLPTGINADTMTPAQFTVELCYKPEANGGFRTVLSRDARNVATSNAELAALYLQVRPDDSVGIAFTDVSGRAHSAYSPPGWLYGFNFGSNPEGTGVPWYHLAGVSDGATLKLYVDKVLVATTNLTASGSPNTALAKGTVNGTDWKTGAWAVGRGLYAGGHTDRAYGLIDEVRISNTALHPGQFLATQKPQITSFAITGSNAAIQLGSGLPGTTCRLWQSLNPAATSGWTQVGTGVFDSLGRYTFTRPFSTGTSKLFYRAGGDLPVPPVGALTWQLAGGSQNWPADIRERIVYAMQGAVAQYNRYGTFRKHITVNYNAGTPTAEANYDGWLQFGGSIGYRVALHEIAHTMGVGTYWAWGSNLSGGVWQGTQGKAQVRAFDGTGANINSDGTHFWNYGLNDDSEGNTESYRRHVLMVAAFRKDMGNE